MEERGIWQCDVPLGDRHLAQSTPSSQLHTALCLTNVWFVMSDHICNLCCITNKQA